MRAMATVAFGLALLAAPGFAAADYTYAIELSVANEMGGEGGNVTVAGTITVDRLGVLSNLDFIDDSLTFTSLGNPTTVVTPANGLVGISGSVTVTATESNLLVTIPATGTGLNQDYFEIGDADMQNSDVRFAFYLDATDHPDLFIGNQLTHEDPKDGGTIGLGPSGETLTYALVPEPSSITLLGLGVTATASGLVWRRLGISGRKFRARTRAS